MIMKSLNKLMEIPNKKQSKIDVTLLFFDFIVRNSNPTNNELQKIKIEGINHNNSSICTL